MWAVGLLSHERWHGGGLAIAVRSSMDGDWSDGERMLDTEFIWAVMGMLIFVFSVGGLLIWQNASGGQQAHRGVQG